jgi:hypothetical protein
MNNTMKDTMILEIELSTANLLLSIKREKVSGCKNTIKKKEQIKIRQARFRIKCKEKVADLISKVW